MGLPELVIIIAVIIAVVLFGMIIVGSASSSSAAMMQPDQIHWDILADEEFMRYIPDSKISAIKRYRIVTGVGLKEAKQAVEYIIAHPEAKEKRLRKARERLTDIEGAGVRDLIADGRLDEAAEVYAAFMGVDKFTAQDAVQAMANDDRSS